MGIAGSACSGRAGPGRFRVLFGGRSKKARQPDGARYATGARAMDHDDIDELTERVIGAAIAVHTALGPGLLESVYRECLAIELRHLNIPFETPSSRLQSAGTHLLEDL